MAAFDPPLTLLRLTTRNLVRRPMRTALTALGVAVGVVAIVAFASIVRGWWSEADAALHLYDADLVVFQAQSAADILSMLNEQQTQARLEALPGVDDATGALWHIMPVDDHPFCFVVGARLAELAARHRYLIRGRPPRTDDEIAIGSIASKMFGKDLGDSVRIRGSAYRIVGVFQVHVVFFDGAIVMSLPRLQELAAKQGSVTAFMVHVQPGVNPDVVADDIERTCPDLVAIGDASEYHKVDQGLEIASGMVWAVTTIAVIIGSIVIANTMWMTVLERTREIGVLRAVGWSRERIVAVIIIEAAGVGVIAGAIGCFFGTALAKLTTWLPFSEQFIKPSFDAAPYVLAMVVSVALSMFGALLPAWRAARISPAEALRYE